MKMTWMVGLVAWWTAAAQGAEVQVFFGNLHSHTSFSDGSGKPDDAFKAARKAGLHFLAVTSPPGPSGPTRLLFFNVSREEDA